MKWYDINKFQMSYDGWYIVRCVNNTSHISISCVLWDGKVWIDYDENDNCFKGKITHFAIPEPVLTSNDYTCPCCGREGLD
jgi:hypothetical protein